MKFRVKRKIYAAVTACILIIIFIIGFYNVSVPAPGLYEVFSEAVSYPAAAQVNINRALSGSGKEQDAGEESREGSSFPGFALISSGSSVTGPSAPLLTPLFLFAVSALGIALKTGFSVSGSWFSRLKHYRDWGAGFLDPVRKMISRMAERYDINPLNFFSREDQPALFISGSAGFLFDGYADSSMGINEGRNRWNS